MITLFIFTARLPGQKLRTAALALLFLCAAAAAASLCLGFFPSAASAAAEVTGIRSSSDCTAYLESLGWTVSPDPISVEELQIPESFDGSYADYLALQTAQGFDLKTYCGKKVTRYTYEITNYPTGETGIQAALLVCGSKIIGGEVLSPVPDGFVHSLTLPDT